MTRSQSTAATQPETLPTATFVHLADQLPPVVWRNRWNSLADRYGLPYRKGYLENLDSRGEGPPKVIFGRQVGYEREALIGWLNERAKLAGGAA